MRWPALFIGLAAVLAGCAPGGRVAEPPAAAGPAAQATPRDHPLMNTLERLRALQRQERGHAMADLAVLEDVTPRLTDAERLAIADRLRACYTRDPVAPQQPVRLVAAFDAEGRVHRVALADPAEPGASRENAARRDGIGRAIRAVVSPACNPIPLPSAVLGRPGRINLRFSP